MSSMVSCFAILPPRLFQYKVLTFSAGSSVSKLDIGCLRWILRGRIEWGEGNGCVRVKIFEGVRRAFGLG